MLLILSLLFINLRVRVSNSCSYGKIAFILPSTILKRTVVCAACMSWMIDDGCTSWIHNPTPGDASEPVNIRSLLALVGQNKKLKCGSK